MLFIFEDEEPALCFLKLFTSSVFPSFGFQIILLLPAVPSDEDRSLLSINLPSRNGLRLLARTIKNKLKLTQIFKWKFISVLLKDNGKLRVIQECSITGRFLKF